MNAVPERISQTDRFDGMLNVMGILAGQRGSFMGGHGGMYNPEDIYQDGLGETIVDKPAEDCLNSGFKINGDENEDILNEFDRLDAIPVLTDCLRWMRLYGGGAILMLIDDGLPLTEPLDLSKVRQLDDLIPFGLPQISADGARYVDPTKKNYGWPAVYSLQPGAGSPFRAHESRLVKMGGPPLPRGRMGATGVPWAGKGALEACHKAIARYNACMTLAQGILERKTQLVHKMSDLGGMLAQGMDDIVAKRMNLADSVRNIFNMLAVDALDDVTLADTNLGGIDAVIRDMRIDIAAKSRMPMTILFGEQVSGLNANAEGDNSIYLKLLEGLQKKKAAPAIEILAKVIWAQKNLSAKEPERWLTEFNPLTVSRPSDLADVEQKKAQARKTSMEAIAVAVNAMILLPEEGRQATAAVFPELDLDLSEGVLPDDRAEPPPESSGAGNDRLAGAVSAQGAVTGEGEAE